MELGLATNISFSPIKNLVDIYLFLTAIVVVHGAKGTRRVHFNFRASIVVATESHLSNWVELLASVALQQL